MLNASVLKYLDAYLKNNEVFRTLVDKLQAGKTDVEIAQGWDTTAENIANERRRWGIYRDNECPQCGSDHYAKVCENPRCITNWIIPEPIRKK